MLYLGSTCSGPLIPSHSLNSTVDTSATALCYPWPSQTQFFLFCLLMLQRRFHLCLL